VLRGQVITVGKWYVNNKRRIARAVLDAGPRIIKFNTHHLNSGNSCHVSSECTRQEFARWADREASASETTSLQNQKLEALLRAPNSAIWETPEFSTEIDPGAVVL